MNKTSKLLLALQQTGNIISLMKGNEYEKFFSTQLSPVLYELQRQIKLSKQKSKETEWCGGYGHYPSGKRHQNTIKKQIRLQ